MGLRDFCVPKLHGTDTYALYKIENATIFAKPLTEPHPPIYLGASSEKGRQVGAKHSDVHLMWAGEPERVEKDVIDMRTRAEELGRKNIGFGIRLHILCRETKAEARKAAEKLIEGSDINNTKVHADQRNRSESEGQRRMNELANQESLWITDTLWMGVNTVRAGAGATLVGTPQMIANALTEYVETGVDCFILSGWPHLEEAEIFGNEIMPLLKDTHPMTFNDNG